MHTLLICLHAKWDKVLLHTSSHAVIAADVYLGVIVGQFHTCDDEVVLFIRTAGRGGKDQEVQLRLLTTSQTAGSQYMQHTHDVSTLYTRYKIYSLYTQQTSANQTQYTRAHTHTHTRTHAHTRTHMHTHTHTHIHNTHTHTHSLPTTTTSH